MVYQTPSRTHRTRASLPLRSFLFKSRFFFLYLMIRLEIIILVRNPQTQHVVLLSLVLLSPPQHSQPPPSLRLPRVSDVYSFVSTFDQRARAREEYSERKKKLRRFAGNEETSVMEKSTE
jgi:hypothetical protein